MKTLFLLLLIFTSALSCKSSDERNDTSQSNDLVGSWKLTETKTSDGNSSNWVVATNIYIINFNNDNTFSRNDFASCGSGSYTITTDPTNQAFKIITLTYSCNNNDFEHQFKSKYRIISISGNSLETNNVSCIEECGQKYKKE